MFIRRTVWPQLMIRTYIHTHQVTASSDHLIEMICQKLINICYVIKIDEMQIVDALAIRLCSGIRFGWFSSPKKCIGSRIFQPECSFDISEG
jgi:hypothetical protein